MSRIRWYHFFFILALFDVVVIMLSLELHRRTLASFDHLIDASSRIDARSKWLKRAQQHVLELNAPGNDLFRSHDLVGERRRFNLARARLAVTLDAAREYGFGVDPLKNAVTELIDAAEAIFERFERMLPLPPDDPARQTLLADAAQAMARMDNEQLRAVRAIDLLAATNTDERDTLLHEHEADLQQRVTHERYFITAVMLILVGLLWFGRRMQQAERALEAERRAVVEARRERLAAIGELCSSVAHGIRNPLASIRSSAQLALELGALDDDSRSRIRDILAEGRRLGDRVTGLLNIARASAAGFEPLALQPVLATAVRELEPEFARRNLAVDCDFDPREIRLPGDRRQLEQAVIELLSNAMEHTRPDSRVRIGCRGPAADGLARVWVEDQGEGVSAEVQDRVFDLFFSTKPSGTGIGLATVKRIARLHGGDARVANAPGGGARFEITLSVRPGPEARGARNGNGAV